MGEAYLADDLLLHRQVVIKRMSPAMAATEHDRRRLLSEAKRAAAINNPHVVQIHDVLSVDAELLLVMEYVDDGTLRGVRKGTFTLDQFLALALQILDGVAAAHAAHVIHCDLKPENILLSRGGVAKVLDFGLARPMARQDAATISLAMPKFAGTPGYMAPEMIREEEVDERADIFALGVIFYELLTGIAPFSSPTLVETLRKTLESDPPPLAAQAAEMPPEVDWIIGKMLAKAKDERYESVREVIVDFTNCQRKLHGNVVTLERKPPSRVLPSRWRAALLSLFAVLLVVGVAMFAIPRWTRHRPSPPVHYRSVAVLPFEIIGDGQHDLEARADGICVTLTSKLARIATMHQLQVSPASEVRRRSLSTPSAARQQLGADLVIEGQMERRDQKLRITYNLVDTSTMKQLRSEEIEASPDNSFALEDKIVYGALNMLNVQLEAAERESIDQRGTSNAAAYDLFLAGSGYLREYENPGNLDAAIENFQGALLKDANYAQSDAALGRAYWRKYQLTHDPSLVAQARGSCQSAVQKSASLPDSHLCLGIIDGGTGNYESAVRELEAAVQAEPSNDDALRELASIYEKTKQPAQAELVYKRGIAARPHYWAGYLWLGGFYSRQARYEEAVSQYQQAIEQAPGNATLYYGLGGIYIFQGKYNEAVEELKKAIELHPTADAYQNLGQAYLHIRDFDHAINAFREAITSGDRNYAVYSALGDSYFWSKRDRSGAETAYKQSIRMALEQRQVNARDQGLNVLLAYNHAALGEEPEAREYLTKALSLNSNDAETMFFAARIYARLNNAPGAAGWLRKAIDNGYSKADIRACPDLDSLMGDPGIRAAMAQ
jgi:eukaryotic-like serine/threonine-protein kinase